MLKNIIKNGYPRPPVPLMGPRVRMLRDRMERQIARLRAIQQRRQQREGQGQNVPAEVVQQVEENGKIQLFFIKY